MKKKQRTTILLSLFTLSITACGQVKTKVQVTEEDGTPIEGAEVKISYVAFKDEDWKVKILGTDPEGKVEDTGSAQLRIQLKVSKEGYYESNYDHSEGTALRRDQDHDLKVILRKRINPVPLYTKKVEIKVPAVGQNFGFDLGIGDWVKPHGKGKQVDFLFAAHKTYEDNQNYETSVRLSFSRPFEGLKKDLNAGRQGIYFQSEFKTTRTASEHGYKEQEIFVCKRTPNDGNQGTTLPASFVFRTRVKLDEREEIISAHYGKLTSSVDVSRGAARPEMKPILQFTYYFNPTPNDRNLEFDPQRNLFGKLDSDQRVLEP